MPDEPGCNDAFHYFRGEGEIWDWSIGCQMIRVQSTFLQPRKYDGLLLTDWKNGATLGRITQVTDDRNQNVLCLLNQVNQPCGKVIIKGIFRPPRSRNLPSPRVVDCLYTGISSGPNAWQRVWEVFLTFRSRKPCNWFWWNWSLPPVQNLISIWRRWWSGRIPILPLGCFVFFVYLSRSQVSPVDLFWRYVRHTMSFHARMCISGFLLTSVHM